MGLGYQRIADELRGAIRSGRHLPGAQLPVERELAATYGVAVPTLRRALALLADEGLVRRERGKGTFVKAANGGAQRARPLFYVGAYEGHLFQDLYTALSRLAQRDGVTLTAYDPLHEGRPEEAAERLRELRPPGAACLLSVCHWRDARPRLPLPEGPVVFIHRDVDRGGELYERPGFHLYMPPAEAVRLATAHLLAAGHRRLAYIAPGPAEPAAVAERFPTPLHADHDYAAFAETLHTAGIDEHRALACWIADGEAEDVYEAYLDQLGGWATGFVCHSDYRAALLCHAAARRGIRIPDDIGVVGVGDTPWCDALRPRLTSVSYDLEALATLAVRLAQTPPPAAAAHCTVHPQVVDRDSVALAPRNANSGVCENQAGDDESKGRMYRD